MTNKLVVIINSFKVPKIKRILLYEMKFLVPKWSCLQNPWRGGYAPISPFSLSSVLNWICWTPPEKNSWVRHCQWSTLWRQKVKVLLYPALPNFRKSTRRFKRKKEKKTRTFAMKSLLLISQHFKHCPLQSSPLNWRYAVPNVSSIVGMLPGTHFLWWRAVLLSHFPESPLWFGNDVLSKWF